MGASFSDILRVGDEFAGRYEITRQLGAGGMGAVFEVLDVKTRRKRALKVMLPQLVEHEDLRRRFATEATIAAEVESDHIAEVLDAGIDEATGAPFIVLELLKGSELVDVLDERGAMRPEQVLYLLKQTASALDKAHAIGVVHRDLKPENLFVTYRDDGTPRIKILDFGIAKVVTSTMNKTQTAALLGTPGYMATEQIDGDLEISGRTDGYALAHIAYTLLVGEEYWLPELTGARSLLHLITFILKGPPEPPSERAQKRQGVTLPVGFDDWFAKAASPDPEERFATTSEEIAALARVFHLARISWVGDDNTTNPLGTPMSDRSAAVSSPMAVAETVVSSPGTSSAATANRTGVPVTLAPTDTPARGSRRPLWLGLAALAILGSGFVAFSFVTSQEAMTAPPAHGAATPEGSASLPTPPPAPSPSAIATVDQTVPAASTTASSKVAHSANPRTSLPRHAPKPATSSPKPKPKPKGIELLVPSR